MNLCSKGESGLLLYVSYTDKGGRPYNEDRAGFKQTDGSHLCAVLADGLGGHGGGQIASAETVRLILEGYHGSATTAFLCDLVQEAHRKVLSLQTAACKMKTTAVVLAVEPKRAQWAYVGDSRLYHFVDGKLKFQTRDHSASQVAVLMGQIRQEEIRFHEDRSRLYRALGQENGVGADTGEIELFGGSHAFLLCSDGFWEYVYEEEMEQELRGASSPEDWLERMREIHDGRACKECDNHTAAVVWSVM